MRISKLDSTGLLQLKNMDCAPLPVERDSIYILFYRFFNDTCRLAYVEDELVGFILALVDQTDPAHAYIHYFFVKEEHRGMKIGEMLLNELISVLRTKQLRTVTLMTGNPKNEKYYSKFGFVRDEDMMDKDKTDPVYKYIIEDKKMIFYRLDLRRQLR
ncbi:GNAT family N-acetyltransferase [Paenibacillus sambharensis]|uniref:GNAT family N-acetyltransferase n=1 Tax=Paenibacillus sambharensis TaxID=1803190 RepID=UPI001FE9C32B|nr:GNAT family N-acetyltransferase [Paenibacillus sambharensis]